MSYIKALKANENFVKKYFFLNNLCRHYKKIQDLDERFYRRKYLGSYQYFFVSGWIYSLSEPFFYLVFRKPEVGLCLKNIYIF